MGESSILFWLLSMFLTVALVTCMSLDQRCVPRTLVQQLGSARNDGIAPGHAETTTGPSPEPAASRRRLDSRQRQFYPEVMNRAPVAAEHHRSLRRCTPVQPPQQLLNQPVHDHGSVGWPHKAKGSSPLRARYHTSVVSVHRIATIFSLRLGPASSDARWRQPAQVEHGMASVLLQQIEVFRG